MQLHSNTKAIALGTVACAFFSSTYIMNSLLASKGGHWAWSAGLRTFLLVVLLTLLLAAKGQLRALMQVIGQHLGVWLGWGSVAFGLNYFMLTLAASFGPGWLVAGVFQFTIVAGILLSPLLYKDHRAKIPLKALLLSVLIIVGIACMQWSQRHGDYTPQQLGWCVGIVLLTAFTWPLANRKLLLHVEESGLHLSAIQRVAGTAIGSLPVQFLLMGYGFAQVGFPEQDQLLMVSIITLSSGVAGSVLFFRAMHLARKDSATMAAVEATQAVEILFTVIGEVLLLGIAWPNWLGSFGMAVIISGLILYSIPARQKVLQTPGAGLV